MQIFYPESLAATVDAINEAYFYGQKLFKAQKQEAAKFIAGRQGLNGAYRTMFAPTENDSKELVFFTGEKTRHASARHILGEESLRVLYLLGINDKPVAEARQNAQNWLDDMRNEHLEGGYPLGMFCCGKCSIGLFRQLAVGEWNKREEWLAAGMKQLKVHRKNDGKWKRFPFYYTLSALIELDPQLAKPEMQYAAPVCERLIKRNQKDDKYINRRRVIMEKVLERV